MCRSSRRHERTGGVGAPAAAASATPDAGAAAFHSCTRRDKIVLALMVGIPTSLHIALVWFPALATVAAVVHRLERHRPVGDIQFVGFRNYWEIFTVFDNKLFPAIFNNVILLVFLFFGPGVRDLLRLPARQEHPRHAHLPEPLLLPGRALAGSRRLHLEERDVLAATRGCSTSRCWPGRADRLRRRPEQALRRSTSRSSTSRSGCRRTSPPSSSPSAGATSATSWCSTWPG